MDMSISGFFIVSLKKMVFGVGFFFNSSITDLKCCVNSTVQQSNSVIYIYIHTYMKVEKKNERVSHSDQIRSDQSLSHVRLFATP